MYSQSHHGLILQKQPGFFLNTPLKSVKSSMSQLGPPRQRETDISSYSRNTDNDLVPCPSLSHPPTPVFTPQLPSRLLSSGLPLFIWQLAPCFSLASYTETMAKTPEVHPPPWCPSAPRPWPLLHRVSEFHSR